MNLSQQRSGRRTVPAAVAMIAVGMLALASAALAQGPPSSTSTHGSMP